ncbi:MAG: hypothetical protein J5895_05500 [Alphaproteobacteria bacterium]|nr:hypothetical protein [Alphaproteobacteria bacterium]
MCALFKYIVFFVLAFNTGFVNAQNVALEPFEDEFEINVPSFTAALNLPHPAQLGNILSQSDTAGLGALLTLGRYFDARYPGNSIYADFSQDVGFIFPEASNEEIASYTKKIRYAVVLYRLGMQKYQEAKEKFLAPPDPPLIVADDEYAIVGDRAYLPTKEGEVAIISDFKKVVGYSYNPREIEAMEKRAQRLYEAGRKKTDFERFKTMLDKIEFSKLTSYGVTVASPFVGNAGIGAWFEKNGFKTRLISEKARIGEQKTFLTAFHVDVPSHRLMLATNLSDTLKKPQIELINAQNVASYEIFYPMPVQPAASQMTGVYRGNFAFPVKITLQEAQKPVFFEANLHFFDCDFNFDCKKEVLHGTLEIEQAEDGEDVSSSMSNFIKQSYFNLPDETNKYLALKKVSYQTDESLQKVSAINLTFAYHTKIKNFALFLENEPNTVFVNPKIVIDGKQIYVQITPVENDENLLDYPLTVSARINNYATIRQTIDIKTFQQQTGKSNALRLLWVAFLAGLLFYATPFGAALALKPFYSNEPSDKRFLISKICAVTASVFACAYLACQNKDILYFSLAPHTFYVAFVMLCLWLRFDAIRFFALKAPEYPVFSGLLNAFFTMLFLPLSNAPYMSQFLENISVIQKTDVYLSAAFLCLGLFMPELLRLCFFKRQIPDKLKELLLLISKTMTAIALLCCVLWLLLPLKALSIVKTLFLLGLSWLVLKVCLNFWKALLQTRLPSTQIKNAEKVVFLLIVLSVFIFAKALTRKSIAASFFTENQISSRLKHGKSVLVGLYTPSCLVCKYNELTTLNSQNLKNLNKRFKFEYMPFEIEAFSPKIKAYFEKYNKLSQPLYVLYTPLISDGIVLEGLMSPSSLAGQIESFNP